MIKSLLRLFGLLPLPTVGLGTIWTLKNPEITNPPQPFDKWEVIGEGPEYVHLAEPEEARRARWQNEKLLPPRIPLRMSKRGLLELYRQVT